MNTIKWGIIGCGDVTEVKSGPAFNKVSDSELIAVMRRDAAKARDYAERHNVSKWYNDADLLINDPEINAVYIATPPLNHEEYAVAALKAGKHVYVEKPMTLDAAGALRITEAVKHYSPRLTVAHYRRQQPYFKKVKELLESNSIGEPRFINLRLLQPPQSKMIAQTSVNWRLDPAISGGGLFHDLAPHQLDLMIHFFGPVSEARGIAVNQANLSDADDLVSGLLVFKNNIIFNGLWSFNVPETESADLCEITGSEGKISFGCFKQEKIVLQRLDKTEEFIFEPLQHVQQPMIEKVVQYFLGGKDNPCPAEDGVHVMELMDRFTKRY